jgi:hypothetical protein
MKKITFLLIIILFLSSSGYCSKGDSLQSVYLKNAMEIGADQFINHKDSNYSDLAVFIIKVISIGKNEGVFSISYLLNDFELASVSPSLFFYSKNKLVLVCSDSLQSTFCKINDYQLFSDTVARMAYQILAGPNNFITAQDPPVMVFHYKREKVLSTYYKAGWQMKEN